LDDDTLQTSETSVSADGGYGCCCSPLPVAGPETSHSIPASDSRCADGSLESNDLDVIDTAIKRGLLRLLLIGSPTAVDPVLDAIRSALPGPVRDYHGELPAVSAGAAGTLIVPEIATLTALQQEALFVWLTNWPCASIVSRSSELLWPRVVRGEFSADLFYRLNVITLDLVGNP
jgi:hypothetical protein